MFKEYKSNNFKEYNLHLIKERIENEIHSVPSFCLSKIYFFFDVFNYDNFKNFAVELSSHLMYLVNRNVLLIFIPQKPAFNYDISMELEFLISEFPISINTFLSHDRKVYFQEIDTKFYQEVTTSLNFNIFNNKLDYSFDELLNFTFRYHLQENRKIIRLWNFIGDITGKLQFDEVENVQNYQAFNNARFSNYSKYNISTFPASTGIGMDFLKLLTICTSVPEKYKDNIFYLSNTIQKEAYNYDEKVLVGTTKNNHPPLFSRGLIFETVENYQLYVSGTSSIFGQESIDTNNIIEATHSTLKNILEVINTSKLSNILNIDIPSDLIKYKFARIYIKNKFAKEASEIKKIIEEKFYNISASYLIADICREELPIEIELYAEIDKNNS